MRLPKSIAGCVVYLFPDQVSAEDGECSKAATAFWVHAQTIFTQSAFLVTNAHVIDEKLSVARWTSRSGENRIEMLQSCRWFRHPDRNIDVAIYPFEQQIDLSGIVLSTDIFLRHEHIDTIDMTLGDDVAMIGLHRQYHGKLTNIPTARFGHIAQFPAEPIADDRGRNQPAFLVQIPSLPGFSGSPVFLIQNEPEKNLEQNFMSLGSAPRQLRLLGVNCGHLPAYGDTVRSENLLKNDTLKAEINSGIIYVSPAWNIESAINSFFSVSGGSRFAFSKPSSFSVW